MEQRRPGVVGPLILITIGVLFLLANMGFLPYSFWQIAFTFWPLILVLVGLEILIGRRSLWGALLVVVLWFAVVGGVLWVAYTRGGDLVSAQNLTSDALTQPLEDIKSATIDLQMGASATSVKALSTDTNNLIQGTISHSGGSRVVKSYSVVGSDGRLVLREEGVNWMTGLGNMSKWDLALNPQVPLVLRVNGGLGSATLDLSGLNVTSLSIDSGVGSITLTTPKTGTVTMRLNGGVGSANVAIPDGMAGRMRVSSGLGSVNVNQARFPKIGDVYQSADYATAANKIDIEVDGGLGSINIQ